MKKITNLKVSAMLALPLLAIIGGFFIPSLYVAIPLWIIALIVLANNLWQVIDASPENNILTNILIFISMYVVGLAILPFALVYFVIFGIYQLLGIAIIALFYNFTKKKKA